MHEQLPPLGQVGNLTAVDGTVYTGGSVLNPSKPLRAIAGSGLWQPGVPADQELIHAAMHEFVFHRWEE
eukprot:9483860-Alexandrium_andersonii.AAC.1